MLRFQIVDHLISLFTVDQSVLVPTMVHKQITKHSPFCHGSIEHSNRPNSMNRSYKAALLGNEEAVFAVDLCG